MRQHTNDDFGRRRNAVTSLLDILHKLVDFGMVPRDVVVLQVTLVGSAGGRRSLGDVEEGVLLQESLKERRREVLRVMSTERGVETKQKRLTRARRIAPMSL